MPLRKAILGSPLTKAKMDWDLRKLPAARMAKGSLVLGLGFGVFRNTSDGSGMDSSCFHYYFCEANISSPSNLLCGQASWLDGCNPTNMMIML